MRDPATYPVLHSLLQQQNNKYRKIAQRKNKQKKYSEAELIKLFGLMRTKEYTPLMREWLSLSLPGLTGLEKELFEEIHESVVERIDGWREEELKMNFIAFVLKLGHFNSNEKVSGYYGRIISADIDGQFLKVKTDFMLAKGILDMPEKPYFHFQEYKKQKDPYGDPTAQLIEAMLIAQELNQNKKPIYGAYIIGKFWDFVVLQGREYCISKSYDCTEKEDLLQIIGILRKFKQILNEKLFD